MKVNKITIYTDGAARGNPGPAGWASIIFVDEHIFEIGGRSDHATNNQMELTAPIEALKFLKKKGIKGEVEFFADSKYVILGITEWIINWLKNNWRGSNKKPVMNRELWEELFSLTEEFKPKWKYIEGHSGDKWNDRADEIATSFADKLEISLANHER